MKLNAAWVVNCLQDSSFVVDHCPLSFGLFLGGVVLLFDTFHRILLAIEPVVHKYHFAIRALPQDRFYFKSLLGSAPPSDRFYFKFDAPSASARIFWGIQLITN